MREALWALYVASGALRGSLSLCAQLQMPKWLISRWWEQITQTRLSCSHPLPCDSQPLTLSHREVKEEGSVFTQPVVMATTAQGLWLCVLNEQHHMTFCFFVLFIIIIIIFKGGSWNINTAPRTRLQKINIYIYISIYICAVVLAAAALWQASWIFGKALPLAHAMRTQNKTKPTKTCRSWFFKVRCLLTAGVNCWWWCGSQERIMEWDRESEAGREWLGGQMEGEGHCWERSDQSES